MSLSNCRERRPGFTNKGLYSFGSEFKYSTNLAKKANVSSNIVALLNAGAFFGAVAPALFTKWVGRRHMMGIAAFLMIVGGVLQTAAQPPALAMIYGGRIISGFGVGMVSNLTPLYVAETAPKELRGLLMSLFEMFLVSGGLLAYWITYGCSLHLAPTSKQWRIPLSIQIILAAIVLAGSFVICESPRWLAKQNRWDEAAKNLCYLRGGADVVDLEIKSELAEMHAQIEEEIQATAGRSMKELFQRGNFMRLVWGCGISFFSIWGGQTALLYYGPVVFGEIGFGGQNAALFASGMFTVIKVVVTVGFLVLGVQQFKRKNLFSLGAFIMAVTMFALGAILKTHPPFTGHTTNNTPSGRGMVCYVYPLLLPMLTPFRWLVSIFSL
jgi:sugar porter (SP) family MFS transporter